MTKYIPRKNLVLALKIKEENPSGILLPDKNRSKRFIKLEIQGVGPMVEDLLEGNIVWAEDMFEPFESGSELGLIDEKYIHCIII